MTGEGGSRLFSRARCVSVFLGIIVETAEFPLVTLPFVFICSVFKTEMLPRVGDLEGRPPAHTTSPASQ